MIRLVQMKRGWGLPNTSPACMKLETWLRLTGIPYELAPLDVSNAPKGKIPYIIQDEGTRLGDSTLITEHLKATHGVDPDTGLTAEQKAIALAFRRMMKEHFYWVILQARYRDERNWPVYRQLLIEQLEGFPAEQRPAIADMYNKLISDQMHQQGMGRHTADEVYRLGTEDLRAISDVLGDKPYFFGEKPSTVDTTLYAYMANLLETPVQCATKDFGLSRKNLVDYCQRMRARFFPDLKA